MSPALELVLLLILMAMLAATSGLSGILWWRLRSRPEAEVAHLAEALAARLLALESLLARLEPRPSVAARERHSPPSPSPSPAVAGPRRARHVERAAGPMLIAVPDLAAPPGEAAAASAELDRRFGAIWALADSGASPEAIARGTGQPIGQVELILGLRRQLDAAATGGHPS